MTPISVGILAGGQSMRMGLDKALLPIGGQPVIRRVLERVSILSDDVILITNLPSRHRLCLDCLPTCRLADDIHPGKGPLGGIHSALSAARHDHCLIVACDLPFLNADLLRHLISLAPGCDAVVPRIADRLETLHAVYSTACLQPIEQRLLHGELRVRGFFDEVHVCLVDRDEVARFDPLFNSFLNMNTPADWDRLQRLADQEAHSQPCR